MSCTASSASIPAGFTAVPASTSAGSGKITLQPTGTPVANIYSVVVQCTTATANTTVSPSTSNLSLTVSTTSSSSTCSASQTSTQFSNGTVLTRQCVGTIAWGQYNAADTNVALTSLDTEMRGTFGNYRYTGLTMIPTILSGQYISLSIVVPITATGSLQFNPNPTYGISGVISLSTQPGNFSPTNSACLSGPGYGVLLVAGNYAKYCSLTPGQTYYLNMAGVNLDGSPACKNYAASCSSANLSYYTQ